MYLQELIEKKGSVFAELVQLWSKLEIKLGGDQDERAQGYKTVAHPNEVGKWQGYGRKAGGPPNQALHADFGDQMELWWCHLNLVWRYDEATDLLRRVDGPGGDWDLLPVKERNSLFLLLLCMVWWAEFGDQGETNKWDALLDDMAWIFAKMLDNSK